MTTTMSLILHSSVLALTLTGLVPAQLSGDYTIDPKGTGAKNFTTFAKAVAALQAKGVSASVRFQVAGGTWTESWSIGPIKGASASKSISFVGYRAGPIHLTKLKSTAGSIVTLASGAAHVRFDGLEFSSSTGTGHGIWSRSDTKGSADFIEIQRCKFGTGISGSQILVDSTAWRPFGSLPMSADSWSIHHNQFDMKSSGTGVSIQRMSKFRIFNNRINLGGVAIGIKLAYTNNIPRPTGAITLVCNNVFTGKCTKAAVEAESCDLCFNTFAISTPGYAVDFPFRGGSVGALKGWIYGNLFANAGTGSAIHVPANFIVPILGILSYYVGLKSDANLFSGGNIGSIGATAYKTLTTWTKAPLFGPVDVNSIAANPKFTSATDFHLTASSPAIGKALVFTGHFAPEDDFEGWLRGTKSDIGAFERSAYRSQGAGCASSTGKTPVAKILGNIAVGESLKLELSNARAKANAAIAIGASSATIPMGGGCTLFAQPHVLLFIVTDASGRFSLTSTPTAALNGVHAFVQFGVFDSANPSGLALSNAIDVRH